MHRRISLIAMAVVLLAPLSTVSAQTVETTAVEVSVAPESVEAEMQWAIGRGCPRGMMWWSPMDVWNFRYAAIAAGDLDSVMCTYAWDAVVIMPGSVARGLDEIRGGLSMMFSLFPDAPPTMTSVTTAGEVLMVTFHVEGPMVSVPDGSDTYVIRHGKIHYQTVHDTLVPTVPAEQ